MNVAGARELKVDADLGRRSAMVSGDGGDDLVVAQGLVMARRTGFDGLSAEKLTEFGSPYAVISETGRELDDGVLADIRLFYDLWYRLKIPFGKGSLRWWYLLTLALRDPDRPPEQALATASEWIEHQIVRDAREGWCELSAEERTALIAELEQRLTSLEQIRLSTGTEVLDNAAVAAELRSCQEEHPSEWSHQRLALATLAWCWRDAGFVLQELNQSLIFPPTLMAFMKKRIGDYDAILGSSSPAPQSVFEATHMLATRRIEVEKSHLRCLSFDGSNWERREFLIERTSLSAHEPLPSDLEASLEHTLGVPFQGQGASLESWDRYLQAVLEHGGTPTDLLRCVADWAANAADLPVDYAIFTVPQGVKLDRPWELELTEVFCYTAFHRGVEPAESGVPFDFIGIQNAIGQRMRYNVVKKSQNYALVRRFPAQSFNLPDIAIGEDANHGGHRAGGIRLSCRVPTTIGWRGRTWKGIADVRLNRLEYTSAEPFKPSEMPIAFRYVKWEKGIAEATYRRDLLFDSLYCSKLEREADRDGELERQA